MAVYHCVRDLVNSNFHHAMPTIHRDKTRNSGVQVPPDTDVHLHLLVVSSTLASATKVHNIVQSASVSFLNHAGHVLLQQNLNQ